MGTENPVGGRGGTNMIQQKNPVERGGQRRKDCLERNLHWRGKESVE